MLQTARSILKRDPAAHSLLEVILTYPGVHALFWYRIAHFLSRHQHHILAGLVSRHAAIRTGISIAPEAKLGARVFIDHGLGVVIGATAVVEDDVTILHGVTLGSRYPGSGARRHPRIKNGAFIGAHAQILGPVTVGAFSKVGAGAIVLNDVPAKRTVVGSPAHVVEKEHGNVIHVAFNEPDKKLEK